MTLEAHDMEADLARLEAASKEGPEAFYNAVLRMADGLITCVYCDLPTLASHAEEHGALTEVVCDDHCIRHDGEPCPDEE